MNIPRIKNRYSFYALVGVISMCGYALVKNIKMQGKISEYKTEILKKDNSRYNRAVDKSGNVSNVYLKQKIWEQEYIDMQDSLQKADSAKRIYYEYLELLDSINNN